MAHEFIDLKGFLLLVFLAMSFTSSTNIDCGGKPFTCLNSTHFMICVDLGGGVSSTIDDFIITCPPTTECLKDNRFECEFPKIKEPTTPLYDNNVSSQNETSVSSKIMDHVTTKAPDEATTLLFLPEKRNTTVLSAFETTTLNLINEVLKSMKDEFTEGNEKIFAENIVPMSKLNSIYDSDSPQKIYSPASVTDTVTDMTIDTLSTPEPILATSFKKLDGDNIMASENVVNNSLTGKVNFPPTNNKFESTNEILKKDDKYKNIFPSVTVVPIAMTEVKLPVNDLGTDSLNLKGIEIFTEGLNNLNKPNNTARNYSLESATEILKKDDKYKNIFQLVTGVPIAITEVNFPVNDPGTEKQKIEDIVTFTEGLDNLNKYDNTSRNYSLESTTETLKKDDKYKIIFQSVTEGPMAITEVNFPVNDPGTDRLKLEDIVPFTEGLDNFNKYNNTFRNHSLESTTETLKKDDKYKIIFQPVPEGPMAITEVDFPVNGPGTDRLKLEDIVPFTEGLDNLNKYDNTSRNYSLEPTTETLKKDDKYKNMFQSVTEGPMAITEVTPVNDPGTDRLKLEDIVTLTEGLDNLNKHDSTARNNSVESTTEVLKKDDIYKDQFQTVTVVPIKVPEVNFPVKDSGIDRPKIEDTVTFRDRLDTLNKNNIAGSNKHLETTTEILKKSDTYNYILRSVKPVPIEITKVTFPVTESGINDPQLKNDVIFTGELETLNKHNTSTELNTPKEIAKNYISALNETLYKSANKLELTTTLPNITSDGSMYNKEKDPNSISLNEMKVSNIQPIVSISAPLTNTSNETTITTLDTIETVFRNTNVDKVIAFQHVKNNSTTVKANSTVTNYSMEAFTKKLKQDDNIFGSVTGTPSEITTANFPVSVSYDVGATNLNITVPSIMISNDTLKLSNKHQTPQSTLSTDVLIKPETKSILENLYPDVHNYTTQDLVVSLITHNSLNNNVNEENAENNTGIKTINETIPILSTVNAGLTETYLETFKPDTFINEQLNISNVEIITNLTEEQLSKIASTFQTALLNNNQTSATESPTTKGDGQTTYTVDDSMINSNLFIDNITYNLPLPQPTSYVTSKDEELSTIASPPGNNFVTQIFNDSYLGIETTTMTSVESSISLSAILEAENGSTLNLTLTEDINKDTTREVLQSTTSVVLINVSEENAENNTGIKTINETIPILSTINAGLTETYLDTFKPDTFINEQLNISNVELITNLTEEQLSKVASTFQTALLNNNQTSATESPTTKGDGQITYTVDDSMINSNLFIDNITYNLPLPQPTSYFISKGKELSTIASPLGNNFITQIFNNSYLGIETTTMTSVESSISLPAILEAQNATKLNLTRTEDINKDTTREVLQSTTSVVLINTFKNFTDEINSINTENESVLLTNINAKPTDITTTLYSLNNNPSIIEETQENKTFIQLMIFSTNDSSNVNEIGSENIIIPISTTVQDNIKPIAVGYTANSDVEAVIEQNLNPYVNVTTSKLANNVNHIENSSSTLLFAKQSDNIAFKSSESVIFKTGLHTELQNITSIVEIPEQQYSTIPRPISESVTSSVYLTNISHGTPSISTVTERTNYDYSEGSNFTEYEQQIRRGNTIATKSDIYPEAIKSIMKPLNDSLRETNVSNRVPDIGERQTTYGGRTTSWPLAKVVTIDNQSNITVILPRTTVSILQKQTENSQVTQSIQEAVDKDLDSTSRLLMPQVITEKQPTTVVTAKKRKPNIVVTTEKRKPNIAVNRMLLHIASSIDQPNVNDSVKVGTQNVSSNVSQRVHDAFGKDLNNTSTLIIPQVVMTEKQPNIVATTDKHPNNLLTTKKHPNIVVTTEKDPNIVVTAEKHPNIVVTRIQPNMTHSVEVGTQFVSSNLTQSAQETLNNNLNSTITFLKPKMDTTEEYHNIGINRMLPRIALSNNQPRTNDSIKIRTQIISLNVTQNAQETFNKNVNSTSTILTLKADATENKSNIAENTHLSSTTIPIIQDNVDNSVKMGTQIVSSNVLVTPSAEQTIGNELDSISTTLPTSKKVTTQKQSNITVNVILSTTLSMAQLNTGDFSKSSTQILNSNGLQSTQSVNNNAEKVNFNITTEPATIVETFNDSHKIVERTKLSDIVLSPVIFTNGVTNNVKSNSQFNDRKYEVLTETLRNKSFVSNASRDLNTKEDINSDSANGNKLRKLGGTNNNGSSAENYETSTIYNEFTNQIEVPSRSSFAYINALSVNNTGSRSSLSTMYMGNQAKTTKKFSDLQKSSWSNESTNLLNSANNSTKILDRDEKQTESSFKSRISRTTAKAGNLTEHKHIINEQHIKLPIDSVASRTSHTNINDTLSNQIRNKPNSSMSMVRQNIKESVTTTNDNNKKNTTLPVDCIKLPRGKYADSKDCRKFYICIGKLQPVVGTCPNNTVFSEINKQCTRNLSHCVRNNQFHCLYNGRFSDFLKDNIYYICVKNNLNGFHRYKLQCQNDYHLNKVTVKCEKNVEMASQSEISSSNSNNVSSDHSMSMVKSAMSEHSESSEFVCKKEGKFPYLKDCRKYYVCTKNNKDEYRRKIKKCSNDEVYDKKKKKCVSADSEEC